MFTTYASVALRPVVSDANDLSNQGVTNATVSFAKQTERLNKLNARVSTIVSVPIIIIKISEFIGKPSIKFVIIATEREIAVVAIGANTKRPRTVKAFLVNILIVLAPFVIIQISVKLTAAIALR